MFEPWPRECSIHQRFSRKFRTKLKTPLFQALNNKNVHSLVGFSASQSQKLLLASSRRIPPSSIEIAILTTFLLRIRYRSTSCDRWFYLHVALRWKILSFLQQRTSQLTRPSGRPLDSSEAPRWIVSRDMLWKYSCSYENRCKENCISYQQINYFFS